MSFQVNFPPSDFGIPTVAIKSCGRLKNISHCIIPDTAIPYDFPKGTYSKLYAPKWLSLTVVGFTTLMSEIKTNMGILFNKVRFEIQSLPDQNMFIQPQTTWKCNVPNWTLKKTFFSIEHLQKIIKQCCGSPLHRPPQVVRAEAAGRPRRSPRASQCWRGPSRIRLTESTKHLKIHGGAPPLINWL